MTTTIVNGFSFKRLRNHGIEIVSTSNSEYEKGLIVGRSVKSSS